MICTKYNPDTRLYEPYEPKTVEEEKSLLEGELKSIRSSLRSAFFADMLTWGEKQRIPEWERREAEIEQRLSEIESAETEASTDE